MLINSFVNTEDGLEYIRARLKAMKVGHREITRAIIKSEFAISQLLSHAPQKRKSFQIKVVRKLTYLEIQIESAGEPFEIDGFDALNIAEIYEKDDEKNSVVNELINRAYGNSIHTRHRNGTNAVHVIVQEAESKDAIYTFGALILGCIFGLILKMLLSESVITKVDYYSLSLVKNLFMKALQIIVGPVVFFSLSSCIAQFTNISELGRLGIKTIALYLLTTLCAIGIGFSLYHVAPVGSPEIKNHINFSEITEDEEYVETIEGMETADFSIRSMVDSIVPENMLGAFLNMNLLQIIFMAVMAGIAAGRCGTQRKYIHDFLDAFNKFFMALTEIVAKFIPVAIFCAMAELMMFTGVDTLLTLLGYAALVIVGMIIMIIFYCIFIVVTTRLNPLIFLKKFSKAMMTAFAVSSGSATMPASMSCCKTMGISDKVASFTIPLGANINMDGSCMVFIITVLFMSKVYSIDMTPGRLLSVVLAIVFLSLGSPTMAGADLVILAVLIQMIGAPVEAIGIIMGIDAIFDMVQAVSNTTGDAAVSLIVANSEKLLDREVYYS